MKKWRHLLLPEPNGQIKSAQPSERSDSPDVKSTRKRPLKDKPESNSKRSSAVNGAREYDFSDSSNCSIKDAKKTDVIFINSDSNSSMPEQNDSRSQSNDTFDEAVQQPKKRGRKKGSKNHKNLIVAAEESFTNKMSAISRNSKVKTTQELLADLQNRSAKPDLELRTAQLTESLSRIDQKLNPQKKINQNVTPIVKSDKLIKNDSAKLNSTKTEESNEKTSRTITQDECNSRVSTPDVVVIVPSDDEIVDVVSTVEAKPEPLPEALTIDGILSQLPSVDYAALDAKDDCPVCTCPIPVSKELDNKITVQIVKEEKKETYSSIFCSSPVGSPRDDGEESASRVSDEEPCVEDVNCAARRHLHDRYKLDCVSEERVHSLKVDCLTNVNGNYGLECARDPADSGLYVNIVPNLQSLRRDLPLCENFNKYSISIGGDDDHHDCNARGCNDRNCDNVMDSSGDSERREFREWHQTLDIESYNGESLKILPYVIID